MPKDPVVSFNQQRAAVDAAVPDESTALRMALQEVQETDPSFIRNATKQELTNRLSVRSRQIRDEASKTVPEIPTLGNIPPGAGSLASLFLSPERNAPRRALNTMLSLSPPEAAPESLGDMLGVRAIGDVATGNMPLGGDVAETVQNFLPAIVAAIPQTRGAKGLLGLGKHLESFFGAVGAAGVGGGLAPILQRAEQYQLQNIPTTQALKQASEDTLARDAVLSSLNAMLFESLTGGATIVNTGLRESAMRQAGVGSETVDQWVKDGRRFFIDLSLTDVSTSPIIRKLGQSLGRFPSVNQAFVAVQQKKAGQVQDALTSSLGDVSSELANLYSGLPREQAERKAEFALKTINASEEAFALAKAEHARLYDDFYRQATETGTVVRPVNGEIQAAVVNKRLTQAIQKETESSRVELLGGRTRVTKTKEPRKVRGDLAVVQNALKDLLDSPERYPTVENFQGTVRRLQATLDQVGGPSTTAGAALVSVIEALRKDFRENLVGPDSVKAAKKLADDTFATSIEIFGGRVGNLLRRIDAEFGDSRLAETLTDTAQELGERQGSVDALSVTDLIFERGGPSAVEGFHRMLTRQLGDRGTDVFNKAFGIHLTRVLSESVDEESLAGEVFRVTNTKRLRSLLGLDKPMGKDGKFIATARAMDLAGIDVTDFMKVLDLTDRVFENGVPDPSQLLTRRVMLGGLTSGANTFAPLRGMFTDEKSPALAQFVDRVATNVAAYYMLVSNNVKRVTSPQILDNYLRLLDPNAPLSTRLRSARRLFLLDQSLGVWDELAGNDPEPSTAAQMSSLQSAAPLAARGLPPIGPGTAVQTPLPPSRN